MDDPARLAIQLYSLRHDGALARQLDIARDAGFGAVETIQAQIEDAGATRALLDERGLVAASGHVSLEALRARRSWLVEAARSLGLTALVVPALPLAERPSDAAGWEAIGVELGDLAAELRDARIALAYHNHDWDLRPLAGGDIPLDLLLRAGAAGALGWQADLAWVIKGGADPAEWLGRYRLRITSIHVKDIAPEGEAIDEDGWADVGHGVVDWAQLWQLSGATAARWMIAEHDKPSDGARFARRSFATMRRLAEA
ncbi:MAG TPA: sugar phosphate isomerase/epimerase [Geminicoccaceae bacterium]|nr:sugar phosphate isomerase/epimerase [Geminicoccaceae bacterium]